MMRRKQKKDPLQILISRPDRLGDVILSTPVLEGIKQSYPQAQLTFLVQEGVVPILREHPLLNNLIVFDPDDRHAGFRGFIRLWREIRRFRFDAAVVLQSHWKVAAAVFFARVRLRVGPLSKVHSYLFYNRGIRQRRSRVEMHEVDYNLQLLQRLGIYMQFREVFPQVAVSERHRRKAQAWLESRGRDPKKKLIQVHPGMGGSALNWPEAHYLGLIRSLLQKGNQILVTGGFAEQGLLDRFEEALKDSKSEVFYYRAQKGSSIEFLGGLSSQADVVVAPSTGPLHLAAALGKPVVSFYPPIRVQSVKRWGPYVPSPAQAVVLVPQVQCGQESRCLGSVCKYFPCMESLTVEQALQGVEKHIFNQQADADDQSGKNPHSGMEQEQAQSHSFPEQGKEDSRRR